MKQKNLSVKYILKMALFILGIAFFLFLVFRLSVLLVPFIIAFTVSLLIEPFVRLLIKKARFPRKAAAAVSLLVVLSIFGFLLTVLISKLIDEIVSISHFLPKYFTEVYNNINLLIARGTDLYSILPDEVTRNIQNLLSNFSSTLAEVLNNFVRGVLNTAISIPEALIFTLVTILSTYFFASDRESIYTYFRSHLPDSWTFRIGSIKNDLFSALFGYIRAQLIMMSITFFELFTGFSIIGLKYALLLALVICIIDALPILGTGGVLIPWALYNFLLGDTRMGISLLILYLVVLIVRQMMEPKILSHQIGLHPLVTLSAMYLGLQLFGVLGMILGPITVLVLKNILTGVVKSGTIKEVLNQIRPPEDE